MSGNAGIHYNLLSLFEKLSCNLCYFVNLFPNISSVLSPFNCKNLSATHPFTSVRQLKEISNQCTVQPSHCKNTIVNQHTCYIYFIYCIQIDFKGHMYNENNIGPRTGPCGFPVEEIRCSYTLGRYYLVV